MVKILCDLRAATAILTFVAVVLGASASFAQVTPAAGYTPPDDTPTIKVGATIFTDYTFQSAPKITDADGNVVSSNAFNVGRAYINVTGNISHLLGFRITPDIVRESGTGSSLAGSLTFRLKYAYAQVNLDDWMTKGSWVRLGIQQTPWVDFEETVYRYRFQGTIFMDREGYLSSSDAGVAFHSNFPSNYGDMQVGIYNGENYNRGVGDQRKDAMGRVSVRVLDTDDGSKVGGLRLTGYGQVGKPTGGGIRDRWLGMVSYRSKMLTLAGEYARTKDRQDAPPAPATPQLTDINGQILSFFGVLHIPNSRAAIIGRVDLTDPNKDVPNNKQTRFIGGVSYQLTPALRLLADIDNVGFEGDAPLPPAVYATKTQGLFQAQYVF